MGMDLTPKNNKVQPFMINWTGWRILDRALKTLGYDANLSDHNDGDYLTGETCKEIAHLIEQNIPFFCEVEMDYLSQEQIEKTRAFVAMMRNVNPEDIDYIEESKNFWLEAAKFFKQCGGCRQY
jgi:hypothetical protein